MIRRPFCGINRPLSKTKYPTTREEAILRVRHADWANEIDYGLGPSPPQKPPLPRTYTISTPFPIYYWCLMDKIDFNDDNHIKGN